MSCNSDLDAVRNSISATVNDVVQRPELADHEDVAEAMDILNRIERRMLANMPPAQQREAAE
jgi:hypothetical protein